VNVSRTTGDKPATKSARRYSRSGWRRLPTFFSTPGRLSATIDDDNGFDGDKGTDGVTPIVVVLEEGAGLRLRPVRWRDLLMVRARASALDRELASGASPESNVALAIHAGRLCEPAQRRVLARSLMRIVAASDAPTARRLRAPVCRPAVHRARAELAAVVDRLTATGPVDVQGVARIRTLLADGTGPLYQSAPAEQLRNELAAALTALDPLG
jgi:hypothetical protein